MHNATTEKISVVRKDKMIIIETNIFILLFSLILIFSMGFLVSLMFVPTYDENKKDYILKFRGKK